MEENQALCFASWNIRGIKDTKKFSQILHTLCNLRARVVFLQETHIGRSDEAILNSLHDWMSYYTVHCPRSKGVAILIRKDVPFEYIDHEVDYAGGYVVLSCRLYGDMYTLVNVYNHKKDRDILTTLMPYLQETARGILLVGGDFNVALRSTFDRQKFRSDPLRHDLEKFTSSMHLVDVWGRLHPQELKFTFSQNDSSSRLDMFFMPQMSVCHVKTCEIHYGVQISDHNPITLELLCPATNTCFVEQQTDGLTDGYINGVEILSAIMSLTDSGYSTPYNDSIGEYKANRLDKTKILKKEFNEMLTKKSIPDCFKHPLTPDGYYNVDYMILATIVARRLNRLHAPLIAENREPNQNFHIFITYQHEDIPKPVNWPFLREVLKYMEPSLPEQFLWLLQELLPARLIQDCPITPAILTLSLKRLAGQLRDSLTNCVVDVEHHRKSIIIGMEFWPQSIFDEVCSSFKEVSGLELLIYYAPPCT